MVPMGVVPGPVTLLLRRLKTGDTDAETQLFEMLYGEMKRIARSLVAHEAEHETMTPTALVHNAYLRLREVDPETFQDHRHFLRVAAKVMRHLLVDQARAYRAYKRGGTHERVEYSEQLLFTNETDVDLVLAVNQAMERLRSQCPERSDVIELHYFAGYTFEEVGKILSISERTAKRHWSLARLWLRGQIDVGDSTSTF